MPGGRPTKYNLELANKICDLIKQGIPVYKICQADDMPNKTSVYLWLSQHTEFSNLYHEAKQHQMDIYADQIEEICETEEDVNRARLKVHTKQWLMGKLKAKKYGDSKETESSSPVRIIVDKGE